MSLAVQSYTGPIWGAADAADLSASYGDRSADALADALTDPAFGDVACKLGRTTGYSCGVTWGPGQEPGTIVNQVCGGPGDSGAPVTVNNRLVGMIHGAFSEDLPTCVVKFIPLHTPAVTMSINTQLADIAAKGRPGTGFRPIGS